MSNQKLMNAAKNWDTMAKVSNIIFRSAGIVFLIFAVLVLILGNQIYAPGTMTLDLDFIKLHLTDECQMSDGFIRLFIAAALFSIGIFCFIVSYGIIQLRTILTPMKEGRPFESSIPGKLRNIAWTILAGGLLLEISALVGHLILTKAYPMEQIFSSPAIEKIEYSYTFDLGFVLVCCIFIFLSYIFAYGQKLQQESDETL